MGIEGIIDVLNPLGYIRMYSKWSSYCIFLSFYSDHGWFNEEKIFKESSSDLCLLRSVDVGRTLVQLPLSYWVLGQDDLLPPGPESGKWGLHPKPPRSPKSTKTRLEPRYTVVQVGFCVSPIRTSRGRHSLIFSGAVPRHQVPRPQF